MAQCGYQLTSHSVGSNPDEATVEVARSRRSDSGERCKVKSKGGGELREGTPVRFVLNRLFRPLRPHQL